MLSSGITLKLMYTYCMDLYGSQIWNYGTGYLDALYVAWRKVTRLIWELLFRTHCNLLHTINNRYSIEFILKERCVNFFHACLSSDIISISSISKSFGDILVINRKLLPRSNSLPHVFYAYCVMYDIHCIMRTTVLIFLSLSSVNGNNSLLSIY